MQTRLNKFLAQHTDVSRRGADDLIAAGRVDVNAQAATAGQMVSPDDVVTVDGKAVIASHTQELTTVMLHKPVGYVCSRNGQGSQTIYELLPLELQHLNSVGRLDKNSSGVLLLTNDGQLANELTHPRYQKVKVYEVSLDKPLQPLHQQMITDYGITLEDGLSKFQLEKQDDTAKTLVVTLREGRNRQIRRTFEVLGYTVTRLHRTSFGPYQLKELAVGKLVLL
ncbi:MAG: pseudouridine synthase [Candidatus Saccharimonadales bacterium]